MPSNKISFKIFYPYLFSIIIIIFAAALRLWPIQSLGLRTIWVTFYPAVMIAALYGGIFPGLLASVLTVLIVLFAWPVFNVPRPFINDFGDWLSLVIFMITCIGISGISEAMRRSQERTRKAKEQAEKANKAKSIFLSNMSHELRTPFNAILGFSQLMVNDPEATTEQKNNLNIIIRSGEHLLHLINNILDIAKIESGKIQLEEKDTNLLHLIYEIQSLMGVKAAEKGLNFSILKAPEVPVHIRVDDVKLRQVLINLIGNAIKFTKNGKIIVDVSMLKTEDDINTMLRFEVQDTGSGISDADKARIFQPFIQLQNENTKEAGTGLGLAICKQNIELMGGFIKVEGKPGQGSVFSFEIPVKILKDLKSSADSAVNRIIKLEKGQPEFKILIAEDQFENRLLLSKILQLAGFRVYEAVNGKEAIDFCYEVMPNLIFMDMRMPVMGGIEATKWIKSKPELSHIAVVALTAHALEDERREMFDAGCDDFIRKPYSDYQIFESITKFTGAKMLVEPIPENELQLRGIKAEIDISSLPEVIRTALLNSAELLDEPGCMNTMEEIRANYPQIVCKLEDMIAKFNYQGLITLLENSFREGKK